MRTIEQFEAEVFSAVDKKKKIIKKRRRTIVSISVCACVCLTVSVMALPKINDAFIGADESLTDSNGYYADEDAIPESVMDEEESDDMAAIEDSTANKGSSSGSNSSTNSSAANGSLSCDTNKSEQVLVAKTDNTELIKKAYRLVFESEPMDNLISASVMDIGSSIKRVVFFNEQGVEAVKEYGETNEVIKQIEALFNTSDK